MTINQRAKEFGAGLKEAWAPDRRDILVWERLAAFGAIRRTPGLYRTLKDVLEI